MTESGSSTAFAPALCVADDATFWPWLSSPAIASRPNREETVVVLPLVGMADWGLGHPLDSEEVVLTHVLREACRMLPEDQKPLVVPPLRFAFGTRPTCAFAVDQATAHAFISEVAVSIGAAGFRKLILLNSSPWSEELCGAAGRDLRLSRGLHLFQVHLSALGLDFHPVRSQGRRAVQTLLTALLGTEPETGLPVKAAADWGDEPVGPLSATAASLAQAGAEAPPILAAAAGKLASILTDIRAYPPLGTGPLA